MNNAAKRHLLCVSQEYEEDAYDEQDQEVQQSREQLLLWWALMEEEEQEEDQSTVRLEERHQWGILNCCGVNRKVFMQLLELFEPVLNESTVDKETNEIQKRVLTHSGKPKGRGREANATCCLGLVLFWYRTCGSVARAASLVFGLTSTVMYKWLL
eukprot:jgi/Psemu1/142/gm1.142_g